MTDVAEAPPTQPAEEARRGRPRPEATIQRDQRVLAALDTPKTRVQLVEELELNGKQVYLSLYRLHVAGQITRAREGGNHVWSRTAVVAAE